MFKVYWGHNLAIKKAPSKDRAEKGNNMLLTKLVAYTNILTLN
jgi:hypothetical protein